MYSQSQSYHSTGHYLEHGQRPIGKVGVSRRVFLYPTMNRGQTHSNVADKAHEESLFAQGRPHYVKSECPVLPPYEPLRRPPCKFPMPMVPPQHQVLLSPPVVHRVTSSAPPFLRYEQIGDPTLRIFKLRLPRNLLSRLDGIIAHSERYAEGLAAGWKTELYSLTRQDLALRDIPGMTPRIRPIFEYITHAIQVLYGCQKVVVDKNQPHILKYSIDTGHTGGKVKEAGDNQRYFLDSSCLSLCVFLFV